MDTPYPRGVSSDRCRDVRRGDKTTTMSESPDRRHEGSGGLSECPATERHRILASDRRRVVLDVLETRCGPLDLDEVAALVAAEEHDFGNPTDETVERTAVSLHHVHLPKLEAAGVVRYDADLHQITPNEDYSLS